MGEHWEPSSRRIEDDTEKIDIINLVTDILYGIKKLWWLILALIVIFAAKSYFTVSTSYTPKYVASATVSVTGIGGEMSESLSTEQMAGIFPYILSSGVLERIVASDIGMDHIPGTITVKAEENVNLMTINVSSSDPQMAYDILHSVIDNYPEVARFVFGDTRLNILDETGVPTDSGKAQTIRASYKKGALQGAVLGIAVLAVYVLTRRTIKSKKELKKKININDLGSLPYVYEKKRRKKKQYNTASMMNLRVPMDYVEAVKKLRIRVLNEMEEHGYKVLVVTSSRPDEGKTTVASNLAIAMAKQGKNVILADCDPRNPSVAKSMNQKGSYPGIGAVLKGKIELDDALTEIDLGIEEGSLKVLFGGKPNNSDAKLLSTDSMKQLTDTLAERADIVILDTAPSELLVDASVVAKNADAALYVIKYDYTKLRQVRNGLQSLAMGNVHILGYVFNSDKSERRKKYGYGYGYGYGNYGSYGRHYGSYGKKDELAGRVIKD